MTLVILRLVAERLLYADLQQPQFATHDVVGRVAHRLVELTERFGVDGEDGIVLDVPLSQEELAGWTGASREAVNKALQVLQSLAHDRDGTPALHGARRGRIAPPGRLSRPL